MRRFQITTILTLAISTLSFSAPAQAVGDTEEGAPTNGFCVTNQSDKNHFFAVDAGEDGRATQELAPGETLCTAETSEPQSGFVSVFETADTEEGCSRLVSAGIVEGMVKYADFDRCAWTSHDG